MSKDNWSDRKNGMICDTCIFFVIKQTELEPGKKGYVGRCRRHAPTMNGFPVVFQSDWCGDHKLNETVQT